MRTEIITRNLYMFEELSEKAKEKARDWWRDCEYQDPAWAAEHHASLRAAMRAVSLMLGHRDNGDDVSDEWKRIREESRSLAWTGYCDDCVLYDNASDRIPTISDVDIWYDSAWDSEIESRMEASYVDENIIANEYEFAEDGGIA